MALHPTHREVLAGYLPRMARVLGMRAFVVSLAALTVVVACSSSLPETPKQLAGQWGGYNAELTDSIVGASKVLILPCIRVLLPAPIAIDSVGAFEVRGIVFKATTSLLLGDTIGVFGTVTGQTMNLYDLNVSAHGEGLPTLSQLQLNAPTVWGDNFCAV